MEQIICLAMGYVFGLFQTGFIYGRSKGIDIRQHGSGNSGSTNALRVMGVKAGLIVFMGDFQIRKSTRLNSSHRSLSRMPSSA